MHLRTELPECRLRPWHPEDIGSLVKHADNRDVWRNLTHAFPHPYTRADAETWIGLANEPSASVHLAIEYRGEAVGGVGAIAGEGIAQRTAQFGYWLGEAHWNKGVATAAARSMVEHLQGTATFSRLEARVFEWNPSSMRVLQKIGFVREGLLRHSVFKDGQVIDSVLYALVVDA